MLHCCNVALLQCCVVAMFWCCIVAWLPCCDVALLGCCYFALLRFYIVAMLHCRVVAFLQFCVVLMMRSFLACLPIACRSKVGFSVLWQVRCSLQYPIVMLRCCDIALLHCCDVALLQCCDPSLKQHTIFSKYRATVVAYSSYWRWSLLLRRVFWLCPIQLDWFVKITPVNLASVHVSYFVCKFTTKYYYHYYYLVQLCRL